MRREGGSLSTKSRLTQFLCSKTRDKNTHTQDARRERQDGVCGVKLQRGAHPRPPVGKKKKTFWCRGSGSCQWTWRWKGDDHGPGGPCALHHFHLLAGVLHGLAGAPGSSTVAYRYLFVVLCQVPGPTNCSQKVRRSTPECSASHSPSDDAAFPSSGPSRCRLSVNL